MEAVVQPRDVQAFITVGDAICEGCISPKCGETNPAVPVPWTLRAGMKDRFEQGQVTSESTELRVALVSKVGQRP